MKKVKLLLFGLAMSIGLTNLFAESLDLKFLFYNPGPTDCLGYKPNHNSISAKMVPVDSCSFTIDTNNNVHMNGVRLVINLSDKIKYNQQSLQSFEFYFNSVISGTLEVGLYGRHKDTVMTLTGFYGGSFSQYNLGKMLLDSITLYSPVFTLDVNYMADEMFFDPALVFNPYHNAAFCPNEDIKFEFSHYYDNIQWIFPGNEIINGNNHFYKKFPTPGEYDVTCIRWQSSMSDTIIQHISIRNDALPEIEYWNKSNNEVCPNDEINIEIMNKGMSYYEWIMGDGSAPIIGKDQITYAYGPQPKDTTFHVIMRVKNSCNTTAAEKQLFINVRNNKPANPYFDFWAEGESTICPGTPVRFNSGESGNKDWSFGDGGYANGNEVMTYYADTGNYNVSLTVTNGCGKTATKDTTIRIDYSYWMPSGDFNVYRQNNNDGENQVSYNDTIEICPGEMLSFTADFNSFNGNIGQSTMSWNWGDGFNSTGRSSSHAYSGVDSVYPVSITIENNCKGSMNFYFYVKINTGIKPKVDLRMAPYAVCPGEKVYFWEEESDHYYTQYKYTVKFGDGTPDAIDIQGINDPSVNTLISHPYNAGTWNVTFIAKNACGNKDSITGIIVSANDATKKPFYYVNNSTQPEGGQEKEEFLDLSTRKSMYDHEFNIPLKWTNWQPGWLPDTFDVYFFYDAIDTAKGHDNGSPFGSVRVGAGGAINSGIIIKAFVPFNNMRPPHVAVVAGWNCNGTNNGEPTVASVPFDMGNLIMSYPLIQGGNTTVAQIDMDLNLSGSAYTGICDVDIDGRWKFYLNQSDYKAIEFNEDFNTYKAFDGREQEFENLVGEGSYSISGDTITFNMDYTACMSGTDEGRYIFNITNNEEFQIIDTISEMCPNRKMFLTMNNPLFQKNHGNNENYNPQVLEHCTGDTVKFTIAGGISYSWDFGDGSARVNTQVAKHVYTTPGQYNAFVIATNSCGRIDTLPTMVEIKDSVIPYVDFNIQNTDLLQRGEPIMFAYSMSNAPVSSSYKYLWEFGDGKTSTLMNPSHTYEFDGNYNIKLTVTNGCNFSNINQQNIGVSNPSSKCDGLIEAKYDFIVLDTTDPQNILVAFNNMSFGENLGSYWDFGNGMTSVQNNDTLAFKPGIYKIRLSVFDPVNNCSDLIEKEIQIGKLNCKADFSYIVNNSTMTVTFNDISTGAKEWSWGFGDGFMSNMRFPQHTYTQAGIYSVCLHTFNGFDCHSEKCVEIEVGQVDTNKCLADFIFSLDPDTLTKVYFTDQSSGIISNLTWEFGDKTTSTKLNPTKKYGGNGVYHVCLTAYNSLDGCQSFKCKDVTIGNTDCKADFSVIYDSASYDSVVFSSNSIGISPTAPVYWNFGDGQWHTNQLVKHGFATSGIYKVCLSINNKLKNCVSEKCVDVDIKSNTNSAVLAAKFSHILIPNTTKIVLTDQSTGVATQKYWTLGDGTMQFGKDTLSKVYTKPGIYNVCLYLYDEVEGKSSQVCKTITVGTKQCTVEADFSFFVSNTDTSLYLNDKSTGGANKWSWNFGDLSTSSKQSPLKKYKNTGYYLVSLAVKDTTVPGCIDYKAAFIQLGTATCKADYTYTVDATNKVTFSNKSTGTTNYFWDLGDGTYSSTSVPAAKVFQNGIYQVGLTASSSNGLCMDHFMSKVQVGSVDCDADFSFYIDSLAQKAYFTNNSLGSNVKLYWVFGDGSISTLNNPIKQFKYPGYYTVGLNTFDVATGCMDYHEEQILIGSMGNDCEADFIFRIDDATKRLHFTNKSIGDIQESYWNFGDGTKASINSDTLSHQYKNGGYYNVCLIVKNALGKENITCKFLKIAPDLTRNCFADFVFQLDSGTNKVRFVDKSFGEPTVRSWYFGDGDSIINSNSSDIDEFHTYAKSDYYFATLKIKNANNCVSKHHKLINVNMGDGLYAGFLSEESDSTELKASGYPVDFVGISHGDAAKLKWDFGDGTSETTTSTPTHVYTKEGSYTACLTVYDPITLDSSKYCQQVTVGSAQDTTSPTDPTDTTNPGNVVELGKLSTKLVTYPNPATNGVVYIIYAVDTKTNVELSIYNANGVLVETLVNTTKNPGEYKLIWDASVLASGSYIIKIKTDNEFITNKLIKE